MVAVALKKQPTCEHSPPRVPKFRQTLCAQTILPLTQLKPLLRSSAAPPTLNIPTSTDVEFIFTETAGAEPSHHQYTIEQVAQTMKDNGFPVKNIVNAKYEKTHTALKNYTNDFALMKTLGARYLTEDWTPETSWDLKCHFNIGSRTLEQFRKDDRHIFTQNFAEDKNL